MVREIAGRRTWTRGAHTSSVRVCPVILRNRRTIQWWEMRASAPSEPLYSMPRGNALFAPLRFIWNATRGHRLAPWRSQYLRWRVETYSGKPAESLTAASVLAFVWATRWELLSFLAWTGRLEREARKRS